MLPQNWIECFSIRLNPLYIAQPEKPIMSDKVVYTAIFGQKDELKEFDSFEGIDRILFTDDPNIKSDQFEIRVVPPIFEDPVLNARYYKILAHRVLSDYQYSLWIDASIAFNGVDPNHLFDKYLKNHDIALHLHPERNCLYDEATACIRLEKDDPDVINAQISSYANHGFPKNQGLISSGIMFRRSSERCKHLNEAWWDEIRRFSRRDQISFPFVRHKLDFSFYPIPGHVRLNNVTGFKFKGHLKPDFRNW